MSIAAQLEGAIYSIGSGGMRKLGDSKVAIVKDRIYYLGASHSPSMIMVTKVGDDQFWYRLYPFQGRDVGIQTVIGQDLIEKGTRRHLKQYAKHMSAAEKQSLQDLLKGGQGKKADIKDYEPLKVTVVAAKGYEDQDLWRNAEEYGNVGGRELPDERTAYEIDTYRKELGALKKDKKFTIQKVEKRKGR